MNTRSSRRPLAVAVLTAGYIAGMPAPAHAVDPSMGSLRSGVGYKQGDLFSRPASSATQCAQLCLTDDRCRSVTFIISQHLCWIKDRVPSTFASSDMVSAIKLNASAASPNPRILDAILDGSDDEFFRRSIAVRIKNFDTAPATFTTYCKWDCPAGQIIHWGVVVEQGSVLSPGATRDYRRGIGLGCKPEPALLTLSCEIKRKVGQTEKVVSTLIKQVQTSP